MAPHVHAPTLMGFDDVEGHCFVKEQPKTEEETYRAIRAVRSSEVQCLRYKGTDPDILRRLVEIGEAEACDVSLPTISTPILRNHVTFSASFANDPWEVGLSLRHYILSDNLECEWFKVSNLKRKGKVVAFAYSWYEDHYYTLNVGLGEPATNRFLVHHSPVWEDGSVSVSLQIDDWLRNDARFGDFRWFTSEQWHGARDQWQERPY